MNQVVALPITNTARRIPSSSVRVCVEKERRAPNATRRIQSSSDGVPTSLDEPSSDNAQTLLEERQVAVLELEGARRSPTNTNATRRLPSSSVER